MGHFVREGSDSNALLESLLSSMHKGVTVIDANLDLVLFNETAQKLLDIPLSVIEKLKTFEGVIRFNAERGDYGPGDVDELVRVRMEMARLFQPHDLERTRPDGTVIRIEGTPIAGGGFITIYSDVTQERAQARELLDARAKLKERLDDRGRELTASRDLLLNAVNAFNDGLGIADSEGRLILCNDRMRDIYPEFDRIVDEDGKVFDLIRTVFPDEPDRSFDEYADPAQMWRERQFPDGRWYKVDRARTHDGGYISVYSDITDYKKQHSKLQQHTDELVKLLRQEKKLSEMQREFVSMASHEFRTPLAIIDSNAQRLKRRIDRLEPEMVLDRVDRIRDSVERMQYLINRFLNFSQSSAVGMEIDPKLQPFRESIQAICGRFSEACASHHIVLDIDCLPDELEYDQKLIELCVVNVLSNAVKYSPRADVVHVTGSTDARWVTITVEDHGVGIPEDEIPKVFDRYFRASTSSGIAGTGIGLNTTSMMMEKHRGRVEVESRVGEGTRICLRLPLPVAKPSANTDQAMTA